MTEVVVFHHALGLTPGVIDFAEAIASAGYEVHTPDLFDGKRFAEVEEGAAHAQSIGLGTIVERGMAAVEALPGSTCIQATHTSSPTAVRAASHPERRAC